MLIQMPFRTHQLIVDILDTPHDHTCDVVECETQADVRIHGDTSLVAAYACFRDEPFIQSCFEERALP
jgi:hypothetical protein